MIATRNRVEELHRTLDRHSHLPERPAVIVVDNGSHDGTATMVRNSFPQFGLVSLPANVGAEARTLGARLATTPYVAFTDDDAWWEAGGLHSAIAAMSDDPSVGLVAAKVVVGENGIDDPTSRVMESGKYDESWRATPLGRRAVVGFMGCAAVVRRRAFLSTGGFDPYLFIGGEEEHVAIGLADAGWKLIYVPVATVRHHPSSRRESRVRRSLLARNEILTACLHYSAQRCFDRWFHPEAGDDRSSMWRGRVAATRSLSWALARRRTAQRALEEAFASA